MTTPPAPSRLLTCPYCHPMPWWDDEGVAACQGYCELDPEAVGLEEYQRLHDTPEHRRREMARRQHLRVVR